MRVMIVGARGQLATALAQRLRPEHDVTALSRLDLDITRHRQVLDTVRDLAPHVVLNGAAYNDVDGAEDDAATALAVNAHAVRSLAEAAQARGATLVHYSTDFVFDGTATEPYPETATPNPRSIYAMSKLLGEWFAEACARRYVLRVESLFGGDLTPDSRGQPRGSSVDRMADALLAGAEVRAFRDRTVSPSFVEDVADATAALLASEAPSGIYHCVGSGLGTWVDVATELARRLGSSSSIVAVDSTAVGLKAPRPRFCALSNARLTGLGIVMPAWQDAIRRYAAARLVAAARTLETVHEIRDPFPDGQ